MSSVNTPLSLSMRRTHNGTMRNGRGLLSAAKTYTESLFNGKARRKVSYFFLFLFFFLFFSRESKITPTVIAADVAAAISPRGYDVVANESVADAVCSYVRSHHVTGGPFAGTVYHTLFLERHPKRGHKSTNANSKSSILKTMVVKCFFFFAK